MSSGLPSNLMMTFGKVYYKCDSVALQSKGVFSGYNGYSAYINNGLEYRVRLNIQGGYNDFIGTFDPSESYLNYLINAGGKQAKGLKMSLDDLTKVVKDEYHPELGVETVQNMIPHLYDALYPLVEKQVDRVANRFK